MDGSSEPSAAPDPSTADLPSSAPELDGLAVLPKTLNGRIQRLSLITSEARELARFLKSQLAGYEQELVISALSASRSGEYPQAAGAGKRPLQQRVEARIRRLETIANEVTTLVREVVEDLRARLEAYQREPRAGRDVQGLKAQIEAYERELILSALRACAMNQLQAARRLGVLPTTLNEKMKRLGLRRLYVSPSDPLAGHARRSRRTASVSSLSDSDEKPKRAHGRG